MNETKTRLCRVPDESFDFLGYTIGRCYSPKTGTAYIGTTPSKKKIERLCREISELTEPPMAAGMDVEEQVGRLNRKLTRVVQLLLPRAGEQSLPGRGPTHAPVGSVSGCDGSTR